MMGEAFGEFLEITNIGKMGPDKIDHEIRRITIYPKWCNLGEDSEWEEDKAVSHGDTNESRRPIIVQLPLCPP
jgi:hypothetical protein